MSGTQEDETSSTKPATRRTFGALLAVIVVVIVVVAAFGFTLSADHSWLASIRDHDQDGYPDAEDAFPFDASEWNDTDDDGVGDNSDAFPNDPAESSDSDRDGVGNNNDQFPYDEDETIDTDGDGVGDNGDAFPSEPSQWSDFDGDGYGDNLTGIRPDRFRDDPTEWNDTDGDGVGDNSDAYPEDPTRWEEVVWTPAATYAKMTISGGVRIIIVSITQTDVPWDDIRVLLSDGTNFAEWDTVATDLDGGSAVTASYGAKALGATTVYCNVTDIAGNGFVSGSDYFTLTGPLNEVTTYATVLVYAVTGEMIGTGIAFQGTGMTTPAALYSKQTVTGGQRINIVSITKTDVPWDDIKILLSDGTNFAEWQTATSDLDGGMAVTMQYGSRSLGSMTVYCNVTDIGGNGCVNAADYFVLSGVFSTSTTYNAVLVYELTSEQIGTGLSFNG